MRAIVLVTMIGALASGVAALSSQGIAGSSASCDPGTNPIVCENSLPGSPPSEWDVPAGGDARIQGYATDISVNKGERVFFKVATDATAYRLDIYRMGFYGGMGARHVATVRPSVPLPQRQPACLYVAETGLVDCGTWSVSASWVVPSDATSGIFFAKLVREDGVTGANHIVFVVRDDGGHSDLLFQTSDPTWQAYNLYGGNSLYKGTDPTRAPNGRAQKVSYNRPFVNRSTTRRSWVFYAEYPMVRWLEANGYDVSYFAGVDTDRRGSELLGHGVFLSVGHDEYWSAGQRASVEAARAAGVNLAFFSGNEVFWKTRWEGSVDGAAIPYRTLVCYKETKSNRKIDPDPAWTGTWRDPRFSPPSDGGRPENALTGTLYTVLGPRDDAITVPSYERKLRLWRNTSVATLLPGTVATMPSGTLGYEWDEDIDNGARAPGIVRMSSTTVDVPLRLVDYGNTYRSGSATHHLTLYRDASSRALVFGAGTVQWSWGLDVNHDRRDLGASAPDRRMQQATVNLLADMGAQPATLNSALVRAASSTDIEAPTSSITSPTTGGHVMHDSTVTVTGVAHDSGGGTVGGVEVSTDDGVHWHPASGLASWRYTWKPSTAGVAVILSRGVDDSGNLERPMSAVVVVVD